LLSNFFLADDGNIGWGLLILAMAVIGVYAYRRGWRQTPYWLRQYIWCAVVLEALVWLPFVASPFMTTDFTTGQTFDFLLFIYVVVVFLDTILAWMGIAIAAVLLVGMLRPAKA
jgi:hypothetical protein